MTEKKAAPLKRLFRYSEDHKSTIYIATFYSILNKLFDLAPPILIGAAVDITVRQENSVFAIVGITNTSTQLIVLGVITLLVWGFESLFQYLYQLKWRNLAQTIEHKLRMDSYSHVQTLDMKYFEDKQTGGLMAILNDDINQLERFLDVGANTIIQTLTTVIVISTAFFIMSPTTAWMALIPMPFIIIFTFKYQDYLAPRYAEVRENVGIMNSQLSNNISGIATIKSYTAEEFESGRIESLSQEYRESNERAISLSSAFTPLVRMIIVLGFTAMLIFAGLETIAGDLQVGTYSVMLFLTQRLLWPLTSLGETFDQYQRAMASTNRVLDLIDTPREIQAGPINIDRDDVSGKFEFDEVTFQYTGRAPILENFNLQINPGETIGLVGSTGAGKSTIIKLLLRFYDPQKGSIRFDDFNIRELDLKDYRESIGFVSQDTFLIDGTIRENIAYGEPERNLEEIIEAAKIAEADEFIATLPDGYDTLVGERGRKLSGGQRQRISIARAILKNPPVLILDEATSDVDNETEAAIQRSLEKIIIGRTTIIIAHRLSTIRNADRIYVLEQGQIIEQGTHEKLVDMDGVYSGLWKVQTGEKMKSIPEAQN